MMARGSDCRFLVLILLVLLTDFLFFLYRKPMKWSNQHDIMLLREMLLFEPWSYRYGSVERGQICKRSLPFVDK